MNMYMLLSRLQSDCEYFILTCPSERTLWAGNVKEQVSKMKEIWNGMAEKPEWLSFEKIKEYEEKMELVLKTGVTLDQ